MNETKSVREGLIEIGLWTDDDGRDPLSDYEAAKDLGEALEREFGVKISSFISGGVQGGSQTPLQGRETFAAALTDDGEVVNASNLPTALCALAFKLHTRAKALR